MQGSVGVLGVEQGQQHVLGVNVVVAQSKCFSEGLLERFAGRRAERDQRRHLLGPRSGERHRRQHRLGRDVLGAQQGRGQRRGIVEQAEQQVVRGDLGVAGGVGGVLGRDDRATGPRGEPAEALSGVEIHDAEVRDLGYEALLGRLLGDAHALADVAPGGAGAAGLVDEMADQVVGDLAELLGGQDRVGQLVERLGVDALDGVDEVVETDGRAIRAGCSMRQP